jgi:hypothetical protein
MNVRISMPDSKNLLNAILLEEIKSKFLQTYENKTKQPIPMYW